MLAAWRSAGKQRVRLAAPVRKSPNKGEERIRTGSFAEGSPSPHAVIGNLNRASTWARALPSAAPWRVSLFSSTHQRIYAPRICDLRCMVQQRDTRLLAQLSIYRAAVLANQKQAWKKKRAGPGSDPVTFRARTCAIITLLGPTHNAAHENHQR